MGKVISKKGSLKIFYYLMLVDGVTEFELEKFDQLGKELLGEEYCELKNTIIEECDQQVNGTQIDENRYDIIQEGIDECLSDTVSDINAGVVPRLLVWNMLTLAHSDNDFSRNENRLISHIVRVLQIDKSVYTEMKQLIVTGEAVQKQKDLLESSDRPYSEIRPLVDEIESRRITIIEAAKALIADDITMIEVSSEEEKKTGSIFGQGKKIGDSLASSGRKIGEKMNPTLREAGEKASQGLKSTKSVIEKKVSKGAPAIKNEAGKIFGKVKDAAKKTTISLPTKYTVIKKKFPADMGLPRDAVGYTYANANTDALVICFAVTPEISMDFNDPEGLIRDLHNDIDMNAGLIEVNAGTAKNGGKYIYHILKHSTPSESGLPMGNTYTVNFNIQIGNTIQFLNGSFEERGITGTRDSMVWAMLKNQNAIEDDLEGWQRDPYDDCFKEGFLMNLSEERKYDEMFPEHPLSEVRRLVAYIIGTH